MNQIPTNGLKRRIKDNELLYSHYTLKLWGNKWGIKLVNEASVNIFRALYDNRRFFLSLYILLNFSF